ncbi:MAG: 2-keto-4-pentenoate hydratase [Parvularculaceae bacterium]|nr:2-keto-4-pentenoate hydratase [Parvularculaceae bacterium]
MKDANTQKAADQIYSAHESGNFCEPVRDLIGDTVEAAYAVQQINIQRWLEAGRRIVGRKIGLTSAAVQQQLGVNQPDFGVLFADMEFSDGAELPFLAMHQPKAEAEIALVLGRDVDEADVTYSELVGAIDYIVPAVEIVGSRIKNWDIKFVDTVADNASSGLYVLGSPKRQLDGLDLALAGMVLSVNGRPVSYGAGAACLGHPLSAALWLARTCAELGAGLKAGDVVLTGALGPMAPVAPGDAIEAKISEIGSVRLSVSKG